MQDSKTKGQQAALALVSKLKKDDRPINVESLTIDELKVPGIDAVSDELKKLTEKDIDLSGIESALRLLNKSPLDLGGLIDAVSNISVQQSVNLDTDVLSKKLDAIRQAIEGNTDAINELVQVAKTARTVSYDNLGRIKEIKLKEV